MLRDLCRTVGVACIISGIILYFTNGNPYGNSLDNDENSKLREKIETLETALQRTEEELANLQMTTSVVDQSVDADETDSSQESTSDPIIKTLLRIEPGTNSSNVSSELERTGIISNSTEFENYLKTNDLSGKIQIGEYELDSSMNINEIARMITSTQ